MACNVDVSAHKVAAMVVQSQRLYYDSLGAESSRGELTHKLLTS